MVSHQQVADTRYDDLYVVESLTEIKTLLRQALERSEDHEARIRSLEKAKWLIAGFSAAVGGTAGSLINSFFGA